MAIDELIKVVKDHRVFIQVHDFPDPDALGSGCGLKELLSLYGIDATFCYSGNVEKLSAKRMINLFDIDIVNYDDIEDMKEDDYIITVDGQKNNANFTDLPGDEVACIDHHPTYIQVDYRYKDIRITGACSSIITQYYVEANKIPSVKVASALLYGIKMDTASFSRGVTDLDIEMFAFLHKYSDSDMISSMEYNSMEMEDLRAYGAAIESIKIYDNIGFACIPFDCPDALIAMVSEFILELDVVELAIIYAYRDGGYKFSVRIENSKIHAGKLTSRALSTCGNGGGHQSMAGGIIKKEKVSILGNNPDYYIEQEFLKAIKEEIKANEEV